jgi:MFS family permease
MGFNFFKSLVSFWSKQKSNWRVVVTRQVFNRFFNQMAMQFSNIYIRTLGASPIELGSVNSVSGLIGTTISIPVGWMHDRYSLRKIFLSGVILSIFVPIIYAISRQWVMIIPAIVLATISMRLGSCAVICDLSLKSEDRATGKALCEGMGSAPALIAPIIAAYIITLFGGISVDGIRPLYWIQFTARFILFLFVATKLGEISRIKNEKGRTRIRDGFSNLFKQSKALKRFILFSTVGSFMTSMITPFRAPFANEVKEANQFVLGLMATMPLLVEVMFSTPLGRVSDRIGRKSVFYLITPILCFSNLLFILATTSELLILSSLLYGFTPILGTVVQGAMTPELIPNDYIGRWRGILGLFSGLVSIPAPIIGGIIWEHIGSHYIFLIPIFVELFLRIPLIKTIPETLNRARD